MKEQTRQQQTWWQQMGARFRSWWQKSRLHLWWQNIRSRLHSWWQQLTKHWVATIIIVFVGVIVFIVLGYLLKWEWTGFNSGTSQITITNTTKVNYTATVPQPSKTLWDWLGLLGVLAIPVVVVWFTVQQAKVSDMERKDNQRAKALQDYIDKMSEHILKDHLGERTEEGKLKPEYEQVRNIARTRTLTVLPLLDPLRKPSVLQFLYEAGLIHNDNCIIQIGRADFSKVYLRNFILSEPNGSGVDLAGVNLSEANFDDVDLSKANLVHTNLSRANFSVTSFSEAKLRKADFNGAIFSEANLDRADLWEAILSGAYNLTQQQLDQVKTCKDAILPKGLTCNRNP
jgi:hypothetical protein